MWGAKLLNRVRAARWPHMSAVLGDVFCCFLVAFELHVVVMHCSQAVHRTSWAAHASICKVCWSIACIASCRQMVQSHIALSRHEGVGLSG